MLTAAIECNRSRKKYIKNQKLNHPKKTHVLLRMYPAFMGGRALHVTIQNSLEYAAFECIEQLAFQQQKNVSHDLEDNLLISFSVNILHKFHTLIQVCRLLLIISSLVALSFLWANICSGMTNAYIPGDEKFLKKSFSKTIGLCGLEIGHRLEAPKLRPISGFTCF